MKEVGAIIGGEGNGGVIYPASHYGRDALVGIALFLSHLAHEGKKVSELRASYPAYFMAKNRVDLTPETDVDAILAKVKELYKNEEINDIDGVKIDFPDKWFICVRAIRNRLSVSIVRLPHRRLPRKSASRL